MPTVNELMSQNISNAQTNVQTWGGIIYNVKVYGAKGDGVTDDTAAIQAAMDAAYENGGGTVFFPHGTYIIKSTLQYREKVNLVGIGSLFNTNLVWDSSASGAILDTTNIALNQSIFENLSFYRGGEARAASAVVTGILGGSNYNVYNSYQAIFRNLLFHDLQYGIRGNGINPASDPNAIGIFDSYFENIWCSDSVIGLWFHGSGNVVVNPRIANCGSGLYLDFLSPQSVAGVQVLGGVFASNDYDIAVPDTRGIRASSFLSCWFETSSNGIINIPNANTQVGGLGFTNCTLSSDTPNFGLMNFFNAKGIVKLDNCNIIQVNSAHDISIVRPNSVDGRLDISSCFKQNYDNTLETVDDAKSSKDMTYYVSPTGNDRNHGLTSGLPLKTIQAAVNKLPAQIDHSITIQLAAGTYGETVTIRGLTGGKGTLTIQGDTAAAANYTVTNFVISRCDTPMIVKGMTLSKTGGLAMDASWSKGLIIDTVIVTASDATYEAIYCGSCFARVSNCTLSNRKGAISSVSGSQVISSNNGGTGNSIGLISDSGLIMKVGTQPAGTTPETALNGGEIR